MRLNSANSTTRVEVSAASLRPIRLVICGFRFSCGTDEAIELARGLVAVVDDVRGHHVTTPKLSKAQAQT